VRSTPAADDYLTKPFGGRPSCWPGLRVILAPRRKPRGGNQWPFRFGTVDVDLVRADRHQGRTRGETHAEGVCRFCACSPPHQGQGLLTHRQILRELWGARGREDQTHYLRVHMAHLRQKLEDEAEPAEVFQTESGIGYRFCVDP